MKLLLLLLLFASVCIAHRINGNIIKNDMEALRLKSLYYNRVIDDYMINSPQITYTPLTNTEPVNGAIGGRNVRIRYYKFEVPPACGDIHISVTPHTGDPDLFVATTNSPPPGPATATWKSTGFSTDSIEITTNDAHYCSDCTYYMAVQAYLGIPSSYDIVASYLNSDHETVLNDGEEIFLELVGDGDVEYFRFTTTLTTKHTLTFVVAAYAGNPDIYISTSAERPSPSNYEYAGIEFGSDVVIFDASTPKTYHVAIITASPQNASIALVASTNEETELIDSHPMPGEVRTLVSAYYTLNVTMPPNATVLDTITFSLDVEQGYCMMFSKIGAKPSPTAHDYVWNTQWWYSQQEFSVPLNTTTPLQNCTDTYCVFYVNILGAAQNETCVFTLTGSVSSNVTNAHVELLDGVPTQGFVSQNELMYYSYNNVNNDELVFTLTAIDGDPDLYVAEPSSEIEFPNRMNNTWHSRRIGNDTIDISSDEVEIGTYYIAVEGFRSSQYTITASSGPDGYTVLLDGVPQSGNIRRRQYRYYTFTSIESSATLDFSLTDVENPGDAVILVNVNADPTIYQYLFKDNERITIDAAAAAEYRVAVYGYKQSSFTIEVSVSGQIAELQLGVPFHNEIQTSETQYYAFRVNEWSDTSDVIMVSVSPDDRENDDPDLYVDLDSYHPNSTAHWVGNKIGGDVVVIQSGNDTCYDCTYFVGVYPFSGAQNYTIVVSAPPDSHIILPETEILDGRVLHGKSTYYMFWVEHATSAELTITLLGPSAPGAATIKLYGGTGPRPNEQTAEWVGVTHTGSASRNITLTADSSSDICTFCWIYVTVQNTAEVSTSYTISWDATMNE